MALWPFGSKEKAVLTPEQRTALTSIVKKSKFEIIPLKGSRKNRMRCRPVQRSPWPSPAKGIEATVELAEWLTQTGKGATSSRTCRRSWFVTARIWANC